MPSSRGIVANGICTITGLPRGGGGGGQRTSILPSCTSWQHSHWMR